MPTTDPPDLEPDDLTLLARFNPELDGWTFTGAPSGPAGADTVVLTGLRVAVDAVDPDTLVEILVRSGDSGPADGPVVELVDGMLGPAAADLVAHEPVPGVAVRLPMRAGSALLATAGALAVAVTASSTRIQPNQWLRGLDVVLHAHRLGPEAAELAAEHAWVVWPRAVSLATARRSRPALLAGPPRALGELGARLRVLLHVVAADDERISGTTEFDSVLDLASKLAPRPARPTAARTAVRGLTPVGLDGFGLDRVRPSRRLLIHKGATVEWHGPAEIFGDRLGTAASFLRPGLVEAHGRAPGAVAVSLPIVAGARSADLADVRIRLLTAVAVPVAEETRVVVDEDLDRLPVATAELRIPARGDRITTIVVDVAHKDIPPPDAVALAALARSAAERCGQAAVAATGVGDIEAASRRWRECAAWFESAADPGRAAQATLLANSADAGAAPDNTARHDWVAIIAATTAETAGTALDAIDRLEDPRDRVDSLRSFVAEAVGWCDPSLELARARASLARALRLRPDLALDVDESMQHLMSAERAYLELSDDVEALACRRERRQRRQTRH